MLHVFNDCKMIFMRLSIMTKLKISSISKWNMDSFSCEQMKLSIDTISWISTILTLYMDSFSSLHKCMWFDIDFKYQTCSCVHMHMNKMNVSNVLNAIKYWCQINSILFKTHKKLHILYKKVNYDKSFHYILLIFFHSGVDLIWSTFIAVTNHFPEMAAR